MQGELKEKVEERRERETVTVEDSVDVEERLAREVTRTRITKEQQIETGKRGEEDGRTHHDGKNQSKRTEGLDLSLRERILSLVKELGGVEPRTIASRIGVPLPRVSEAAKMLVGDGLVKVARNIPDLWSKNRANLSMYLDGRRATALHDTVMNTVWTRNIELGGTSRGYSFKFNGKTWCTDGLLENTGGRFLLEVVAGAYSDRVEEQLQAYSTELRRNRGLRGALVVVVENRCFQRLRGMKLEKEVPSGTAIFIASLRSRDEKLQFESLLKHGSLMTYHRNQR